jgi:hypothetical protein
MGIGLGLHSLRYKKEKATAAGKTGENMDDLGDGKNYANVGQDCCLPEAIVMLESRNQI